MSFTACLLSQWCHMQVIWPLENRYNWIFYVLSLLSSIFSAILTILNVWGPYKAPLCLSKVILRLFYDGFQKLFKRPMARLPNRPLVRDSNSWTPLAVFANVAPDSPSTKYGLNMASRSPTFLHVKWRWCYTKLSWICQNFTKWMTFRFWNLVIGAIVMAHT